jgi:hypothetical protein
MSDREELTDYNVDQKKAAQAISLPGLLVKKQAASVHDSHIGLILQQVFGVLNTSGGLHPV